MIMIDSHCHLADEAFAGDLEAVVDRARQAGLQGAMVILEGGNTVESAQAGRLQSLWPAVVTSVGVHPHQAHQFAGDVARAVATVRDQIAATPSSRAVGEIGLDYHYDLSPREVQHDVFGAQVRLARDLRLPVIVHTREADADTIEILERDGGGEVAGVFHCFTGNAALAGAALRLGFYISAAGIVTFPKASELRDTLKTVPLDRLLTETDSPFLAPVPYRGKRNEPAHVVRVVETLAALHGVATEAMAAQTAANFRTLFGP